MGIRKHRKFVFKAFVFLCLLGIIVCKVNRTLIKKYLFNVYDALTEALCDFYEMERDSVDVLFLGSSQSGAAFNPQNLYDEYNITSYNLSSNQQSLWGSYYWLKEAVQYQTPQVVILDCYNLWFDKKKDEVMTRNAFDNMRLGAVKLEGIDAVCNFDESQSMFSYLLTNIRYHERWTELDEMDFTWKEDIAPPSKLKGFFLYKEQCGYQDYAPLEIQGTET